MIIQCCVVLCLVKLIFGCSFNDRTIICSGMNLTEIPSIDDIDTNETTNDIRQLDLSFNLLQIPLDFSNWTDTAVESLDLSHNLLFQINFETFTPLKNLTSLNLSNNKISKLKISGLNLPLIQYLNLANNNLGNALNIYSDLRNSSITHLNLSATDLSLPSADVFSYALKLKSLDLSNNRLSYVPNLPSNLEYFDFSNNSISHLDPDCFSKDINLKTLLFENNLNLDEIRYETFSFLFDLRVLSFKGCSKLAHLPTSVLYYNKKLEHLSLADCNFKNISVLFKSSFLSIKKIDLENNPWHCSSHIKWFVQLHNRNIISDDVRCSTPENISLVDYLGPKVKHKAVRILLVIVSVILFCILITAFAFSLNMEKKRRKTLNSYKPLERSSKPYRGSMIYVTSSV